MAQTIKGLCRGSFCLANNVLFKTNPINAGVRFLYTERALGITAYEASRKTFHNQFATVSETFRSKMLEVCNTPNATVFTEDMKAMVHLINNSDQDLELLESMILRYIETNKEFQFGTYMFGPVVMRMYSYLKEPVKAFESFNKHFDTSFYHQMTSVQILFNLLYSYNMYPEMREIYDKILSSESWSGMANRCIYVLVAGCYKENTPESLAYASSKWKKLLTSRYKPNGKSTTLLAYLALNQNVPELALELACVVDNQRIPSIRSIKCLACTYLKKYLNIIPQIKSTFIVDSLNKPLFFGDVVRKMEEFVIANPGDGSEEVLSLISLLKAEHKLIEDRTIEDVLLKPYDTMSRLDKNKKEFTSRGYYGNLTYQNDNVQRQYSQRKV